MTLGLVLASTKQVEDAKGIPSLDCSSGESLYFEDMLWVLVTSKSGRVGQESGTSRDYIILGFRFA